MKRKKSKFKRNKSALFLFYSIIIGILVFILDIGYMKG